MKKIGKVDIVISSINELNNIEQMKDKLLLYGVHLIIVDEGDEELRKKNDKLLEGLSYVYYGPDERMEWFKEKFEDDYRKYLSVIPEKCHAETSFGFLIAYERMADMVIELDDDVFYDGDLIKEHWYNLFSDGGNEVVSSNKWYNPINLYIGNDLIFPRGFPFALRRDNPSYEMYQTEGKTVLNMGLWIKGIDLDAISLLHYGAIDGRVSYSLAPLQKEKTVVGKGNYFPICSMNTAFRPEVIPAFYQLYMNFKGIDRFDDIWSGLFLKKVADHLGDKVSFGIPVVTHDKRPRYALMDLKKEIEGIIINEELWKFIDLIELKGETYKGCYHFLVTELEEIKPTAFPFESYNVEFWEKQFEMMKRWIEIIDVIDNE